jgi:hypothetical protein
MMMMMVLRALTGLIVYYNRYIDYSIRETTFILRSKSQGMEVAAG